MQRLEQYDVFSLPADQIYCDEEFNCRGQFTVQSISDLASSIQEHGLQFPVVVQPVEDMVGRKAPPGYRWRLLAGYRRYHAATMLLKWKEIPACIRSGLSDHAARVLNFTENLERSDLNMLEEAKAIQNLYPEGVTLKTASAELKRPSRWVHIRRRLLTLPEEVQQKAAAGFLSAVNVEAILQLEDPAEQIEAAEEITRLRMKGKTRALSHLAPRYRRRFRARKTKTEINAVIAKMLDAGINGLAPRCLAWAAGYVPDEELFSEIRKNK